MRPRNIKNEIDPVTLSLQIIERLEKGKKLKPLEIQMLREMVERKSKVERQNSPAYEKIMEIVCKNDVVARDYWLQHKFDWWKEHFKNAGTPKSKIRGLALEKLAAQYCLGTSAIEKALARANKPN